HRSHARRLELIARDRLQVEVAAPMHAPVISGELTMNFLPHLVAAAARPRADRRLERPVAAELAHCPYALGDDSGREAPPSGVEHGHGPLSGERDRKAV